MQQKDEQELKKQVIKLPNEIWEYIFIILFQSNHDHDIQKSIFIAANGISKFMRDAVWRVRKMMILRMSSMSMDSASKKGQIDLLDWWVTKSGLSSTELEEHYTSVSIGYAAEFNRINVLDWWKYSGLPLKYDKYALEKATENSHRKVLEWWQKNDMRFVYTACPLDIAIINGKYDAAEWWLKESGQPMLFHISVNKLIRLKLCNIS